MKIIAAKYIFDGFKLLENKALIINNYNVIIDIINNDEYNHYRNYVYYNGIISPGFINSHTHMELSFLKKKIKKNIGLTKFINEVISKKKRQYSNKEKYIYMRDAYHEMIQEGIVAVVDISNNTSSFLFKKKFQKINYHTFLEIIDINHNHNNIKSYLDITRYNKLKISITPHAPYSVKEITLKMLGKTNQSLSLNKDIYNYNILTIHNQESIHENIMFKYGKGKIIDMYKKWNYKLDNFKCYKSNSLLTYLPWIINRKVLLVHNTYTNYNDFYYANQYSNVYWCLCPNANLYINNKIPDKHIFESSKILLGTDSYASNNSLSILSEIKTIQKFYPNISLTTALKWCTSNPSSFFEWNHLGKIKIGLTPGINLITDIINKKLTNISKIKVLI
ncbi:MAG: amidohydrolase family protein [Bacteroides sp.]|nr:MAG: amidohydrolase family protein [Bacteroides sp.]